METSQVGMRPLPLYYPYIFVRHSDWLRACALYWPRLAVLRPEGFHPGDPREGDVGRALRAELGFFLDIDPAPYVSNASGELLALVHRHEGELRTRYGDQEFDGNGFVMDSQMSDDLRSSLVAAGLARAPEDVAGPSWLDMHPRLATAYTNLLMTRVADANELALVTDQAESHMAPPAPIDIAESLLADVDLRSNRSPEDVASVYSVAAIRTVVPAELERVPVQKIITARRELAEQFDAFRAHLDELSRHFTELAAVADPAVLHARVEMLVHDQLSRPVKDLRRELRSLGLQPAQAILSLKTLTPPTVVAALGGIAGVPSAVTAAGSAAACVIGVAHAARRDAKVKKRSPAGYLLGLDRTLTPRTLTERARATFSHRDQT